MNQLHQFVQVRFNHFKAFKSFQIDLKHFNILVGPNNAGKSTILAAFRILDAALKKATSRNATILRGPQSDVPGYHVDLSTISIAHENLFYNYDETTPSYIVFNLSNNNTLMLYFPAPNTCYLIPDAQGKPCANPTRFKSHFNCPIGFVPILGPVEHHEPLYEKEAARLALFNYRAARNFRNIWYHYPDKFDDFRSAIKQTWPGMDINPPEIDISHDKPRLHMYCPENRIDREIFWAGFGFQVWCQMLTHIVQARNCTIFLIDEPDIYLHSDLQRQLLSILRDLGPDILIATHSTEIILEAETDDIVVVNKNRQKARRIKDPAQLYNVLDILGSNMNPVLTQLAKTRRVIFVEGKDFQVLSKFARKLGQIGVANCRDFAVVPVGGFNPERIRNLKVGMETTLGTKVRVLAILDKDYRCDEECQQIISSCTDFCDDIIIHKRKEIENFLLVSSAIEQAINKRLADRERRFGGGGGKCVNVEEKLIEFSESKKNYITSRILAEWHRFERQKHSGTHEATVNESALNFFENLWSSSKGRLLLVPGKEALSAMNAFAQNSYAVSVTPSAIIDAMRVDEVPSEVQFLVEALTRFSTLSSKAGNSAS